MDSRIFGRGRQVCCALVPFLVAVVVTSLSPSAHAAVTFGQLDDFQAGTDMGWAEGVASPNPPANVAGGGPRGAGDAFLQNVSGGGQSAGGKMVMFNSAQWAGDYNAAGVTQIDASVANLGQTPLFMRIALLTGTAVYSSTNPIELPANGGWRRVTFGLAGDALSKVEGTETLGQALSHVMFLRILSAEAGPAYMGDPVAATLGIDDIRALRLPGDANFDGRVDASDFRVTRLHVGGRGMTGWAQGDFDFDGRVSARDLAMLQRHFGQSIPAPAQPAGVSIAIVPEPATVGIVAIVSASLLSRRRGRQSC